MMKMMNYYIIIYLGNSLVLQIQLKFFAHTKKGIGYRIATMSNFSIEMIERCEIELEINNKNE